MTDDDPNEGYEVVPIEPGPHGPRSFALHFGLLDKFDPVHCIVAGKGVVPVVPFDGDYLAPIEMTLPCLPGHY